MNLNQKFYLLPIPKEITIIDNSFITLTTISVVENQFNDIRIANALVSFSSEIQLGSDCDTDYIQIYIKKEKSIPSQGYRLSINKDNKIYISASSSQGAFYAIQTLRQLARNPKQKIPSCSIFDYPDYPVRGFYHDITRGKVPTIDTLKSLIQKMAFYKLNQLQLYIEHTFQFSKHPDIWQGSDPLSHNDILELDKFCREHFIDFVPSFSTFGHLYTAISSPRKSHLNELNIDASEKKFSFWDRMQHYTLDCSNKESIKLVEEIISETAPLFKSKFYNICCDETFDLGKGKNKEKAEKLGKHTLYLNFLKKIMCIVEKNDKIPMFWGDIILEAPQLLNQIPKNAIALDWDYSPDCSRRDCKPFADSGLSFYVCSGVHGWNKFLNDLEKATSNITNFAKKGLKFGASGFLNTDWGDYGHINPLSASYHGLILGATTSWNITKDFDIQNFDTNFSYLEFNQQSDKITKILREISKTEKISWCPFVWWTTPSDDMNSWHKDPKTSFFCDEFKKVPIKELKTSIKKLNSLYNDLISTLKKSTASDPLAPNELITACEGSILLHEAFLALYTATQKKSKISNNDKKFFFTTADKFRHFELRFSQIWHKRNRPSEYYRIKLILCEIANRLDKIALGKTIHLN